MRCEWNDDEPPFLSLATCQDWEPLAKAWGVSDVARSRRGFLRAYERARGQVRALDCAWRRKRRAFIARHYAQIEQRGNLWDDDGLPSRQALALVMWAWHPEPVKLRAAYRRYLRMDDE